MTQTDDKNFSGSIFNIAGGDNTISDLKFDGQMVVSGIQNINQNISPPQQQQQANSSSSSSPSIPIKIEPEEEEEEEEEAPAEEPAEQPTEEGVQEEEKGPPVEQRSMAPSPSSTYNPNGNSIEPFNISQAPPPTHEYNHNNNNNYNGNNNGIPSSNPWLNQHNLQNVCIVLR